MTKQEPAALLATARIAAAVWRDTPVRARLRVIGEARRILVRDMQTMLDGFDWQRPAAETLVAEILPLADAARFLQAKGAAILATRKPLGARPMWLMGVRSEIRREPCGVVLILAPGNYPLFLPGVQILQALAAGNAACVKPAPGRAPPILRLAAMLREAGLPAGLLHILDETPEAGEAAARAGFDRIVLTGSAQTGARVLAAAAAELTPCTMELSGNDAVFVLPGADLGLVADCLAFGLRLNHGATCIGPRRVFLREADGAALERLLRERLASGPPVPVETMARVAPMLDEAIAAGARLVVGRVGAAAPIVLSGVRPTARLATEEVFAPVLSLIPVADTDAALAAAADSRYALGASIFGPEREARALAARVKAGSVVVNDLIVPTADPRMPFGGRGRSGFGVTRGAEGLLEMTVVKTVSTRTGRFRPHLASPDRGNARGVEDPDPGDARRMEALIRAIHGSGRARFRAIRELLRPSRRR